VDTAAAVVVGVPAAEALLGAIVVTEEAVIGAVVVAVEVMGVLLLLVASVVSDAIPDEEVTTDGVSQEGTEPRAGSGGAEVTVGGAVSWRTASTPLEEDREEAGCLRRRSDLVESVGVAAGGSA
jgi:hypothetical protein